MDNALLILNAGSSSLKFAVYEADAAGTLQAGYRGVVKEIGRHSTTPTASPRPST